MDTTGRASSLSRHQLSTHQTSKPQPTRLQGSLTSKRRRAVGAYPAARGKETRLGMVRRVRRINRTLAVAYPNARCELGFRNPYGLAVATILSAQCMGMRVSMTMPALFVRYPSPTDLAVASQEEVEELVRPAGFYRNKAANIIGLTWGVVEQYGGETPGTLDELVKLLGVGHKTASVVLGNAFRVSGLTVGTHFGRLVRRIDLTEQEDLMRAEHEMIEVLLHAEWVWFSHRLISHGRRVCHPHWAACGTCFLAADCPSYDVAGPAEPEMAEELIEPGDREWLLYPAGLNGDYSGEESSVFDDGDNVCNTTVIQDQSRNTFCEWTGRS